MSSSVAKNETTEPEPKLKRRKLLDAGGPIEDDETARQKMKNAIHTYKKGVEGTRDEPVGFDPDNLADIRVSEPRINFQKTEGGVTAMGHFTRFGDLRMMGWLFVNGADTRDVHVPVSFPMLLAAVLGELDVCKWLFDRGAAKDIKRRTRETHPDYYPNGRSPLHVAFGYSEKRDLIRWLILKGALCKDDDSGELDVEIMKQDLDPTYSVVLDVREERKLLLEWANDLHQARYSSLLFLSGSLSAPGHAHSTRSALQRLGGKPGILELIWRLCWFRPWSGRAHRPPTHRDVGGRF